MIRNSHTPMDLLSWRNHSKESGIYMIKWDKNSAFYIGQSKDLHCRKRQHVSDFNNNRHSNERLQRNFNKYGMPNFYCITTCSPELLNSIEQYLIDSNIDDPNFCNMSTVASSSFSCPISVAKGALKKTGRPLSKAHRSSISSGLLESYRNGRTTNLGGIGVDNPFFGKKHTQETKDHLSTIRKGLMAGGRNGRAVKVLNKSTGVIFDCVKNAAESEGIVVNMLRKKLAGRKFNDTNFVRYEF